MTSMSGWRAAGIRVARPRFTKRSAYLRHPLCSLIDRRVRLPLRGTLRRTTIALAKVVSRTDDCRSNGGHLDWTRTKEKRMAKDDRITHGILGDIDPTPPPPEPQSGHARPA